MLALPILSLLPKRILIVSIWARKSEKEYSFCAYR